MCLVLAVFLRSFNLLNEESNAPCTPDKPWLFEWILEIKSYKSKVFGLTIASTWRILSSISISMAVLICWNNVQLSNLGFDDNYSHPSLLKLFHPIVLDPVLFLDRKYLLFLPHKLIFCLTHHLTPIENVFLIYFH